jgi:uncharacterized membrane protein
MNVPIYITISVVTVAAFAVIALPLTLARISKRYSLPSNIALPVGIFLGLWLVLTTILAMAGDYQPIAHKPPALGYDMLLSLVFMGAAIIFIPGLRQIFWHEGTQASLIAVQIWRIEGVIFLILMVLKQLPALFAVPAGIGDLFVGLTAPLVARYFNHPGGRQRAIIWNLLGILDLINATSMAMLTIPGPFRLFYTSPTSSLVTYFPVALIPTFLVPLSFMLHLISLRYIFSKAGRSSQSEKISHKLSQLDSSQESLPVQVNTK